jgi:UDP-N-acetylglucosamine acyltransferase
MVGVHATAWVHPTAQVSPAAVVGPHSSIGAECVIHPYAVVGPHTSLGAGCVVYPFAVIGGPPQDRRTPPDATTRLVCGDANTFREHSTVSRGTPHGGGETRLGAENLLMTGAHVGHDALLGDGCVLANGVSLAGHVEVGDRVTFGGHAGVHQFVRVGALALVAANSEAGTTTPWIASARRLKASRLGTTR